MLFDADSFEDAYLDYVAEHKSDFMSTDPPRILSMEDALRSLANEYVAREYGIPYPTIGRAPRRRTLTRRRRVTTMAKKSKADKVAKKVTKLGKQIDSLKSKRDKKVAAVAARFDKRIAKLEKKRTGLSEPKTAAAPKPVVKKKKSSK